MSRAGAVGTCMRQSPSIHCKVNQGGLEINSHCLLADEPEQIVDRLFAVLDA